MNNKKQLEWIELAENTRLSAWSRPKFGIVPNYSSKEPKICLAFAKILKKVSLDLLVSTGNPKWPFYWAQTYQIKRSIEISLHDQFSMTRFNFDAWKSVHSAWNIPPLHQCGDCVQAFYYCFWDFFSFNVFSNWIKMADIDLSSDFYFVFLFFNEELDSMLLCLPSLSPSHLLSFSMDFNKWRVIVSEQKNPCFVSHFDLVWLSGILY